jgi:hypothetical protein
MRVSPLQNHRGNRRLLPAHLLVRGGEITCPRSGRSSAGACRACGYFQGSLEGPDAAILCGYLEGRPAITRPLIFGLDWPDD